MAIIEIHEEHKNSSAEYARDGKTCSRIFNIVDNDGTKSIVKIHQDLQTISQSLPRIERFPKYFEPHPDNQWLPYVDLKLDRLAPKMYKAECRYEAIVSQPNSGNPIYQEPDVSMYWVRTKEPVEWDVTGFPIINSAGDKFDPMPEKEFDDIGLTYTRFEVARGYRRHPASMIEGCVNADNFLGATPGTVRFTNWKSNIVRIGTAYFARVTYQFVCRQWLDPITGEMIGWRKRLFNCGFKERKEGKIVPIRVNGLSQTPIACPLGLNGIKIPDEDVKRGVGYWLTFDVYPYQQFSVLNITPPSWW